MLALRDVTTRGSAAYDPAELVRAASGLLADDPELLAPERRRLAFVYVDELAETDPAQIELLALVAGGGKPLVAFGDPDSSVFGFRGADPGAVAAFPARFRTALGGAGRDDHPAHQLPGRGRRCSPRRVAVARRMRGPMTPPPDAPSPAAPDRPADDAGAERGSAGSAMTPSPARPGGDAGPAPAGW